MLDDARWYSESFAPSGGVAAEGVRNQLGRPDLSIFDVLIREAIQNSWDARCDSLIDFSVRGWELDGDAAGTAAELLARSAVEESTPLLETLQQRPLRLLAFSDEGTTGLGGPTRADVLSPDGAPRDFVAFVRNIGEARDKEFGAGTFGFGKAAFYTASCASTLLIYTRCRGSEGGPESRFIGCALGTSFTKAEGRDLRPFTGRHWWGEREDDLVEPLRGRAADAAAEAFGIAPMNEGYGSTIVVLDPFFDDPPSDMQALAYTVAWHAWPKLLPLASGRAEISAAVSWNGDAIPIPDPEETPPMDAFVTAFRRLNNGDAIESQRPRTRLGTLHIERRLVPLRQADAPAGVKPPLESPTHHVALLRTPGFIVKYLEGPALSSDFAEYAGVFRTTEDVAVDEAFAAAEPPTHDDWIYRQLRGEQRKYVRVALERIRAGMQEISRPVGSDLSSDSMQVPLGRASSRFAPLVATVPGPGAGASVSGGTRSGGGGNGSAGGGAGGGRGRSSARVQAAGAPEFGTFNGEAVVLFACRVLAAPPNALLAARAVVAVDERAKAEAEAPLGAAQPLILGWIGPEGEVVEEPLLEVDDRHGQVWRVAVRPVADTMTVASFGLRVSDG